MTSEILKTQVLEHAFAIMQEKGFPSIRMRELAEKSECAVGTLYNVFENLDEIHYRLNLRTFKKLFDALYSELETLTLQGMDLEEIMPKLGWVYINFGKTHFHMWKALFESTPKSDAPSWYRSELSKSFDHVEDYLAGQFDITKDQAHRLVNYFWFAIHGVSSIMLHKRAINHTDEFLNSYVEHCLRGIYKLA